jgi:hypothetical protein
MRYLADILRAISIRLLLCTGLSMVLFPALDRLLLLLAGHPDQHPFLAFFIVLLVSVVLVELGMGLRQRQLRRRYVEQPLVSHSWPAVRLRLIHLNRWLDTSIFFPWQANGLRNQLYPLCLKAAGRADEPDLILLQLLEMLMRQRDPETAAEVQRLFAHHFAQGEKVHPAALPGLMFLYTSAPDLVIPLAPSIQRALIDNPRHCNRSSFDFMQAFPHMDFYGTLSRLYARLHDAPIADTDLLQKLLVSGDCKPSFRRITRRKLQRLTVLTQTQSAILTDLEKLLGTPLKDLLSNNLRPVLSIANRPLFIYSVGGLLVLVLLFKLGSWVFTSSETPTPAQPLLFMADSAAFTVQVMATRDSTFAIREATRLTEAGYYSYVMSPRVNSTYFRVRTGLLAHRAEADTLAQLLLREQLISEFYVAPFDSSGLIITSTE